MPKPKSTAKSPLAGRKKPARKPAADPAVAFTLPTGESVHLRRAGRADMAAIVAIENDQFSNPWKEEHFVRELDNRLAHFFVCEECAGRRVVAYMIFWLVDTWAELHTIAVVRQYQRRGIAARMLHFLIECARGFHCQRIFLDVRPSNRGAIRLYEQMGFRRWQVRKDYYQKPAEDALVYVLEAVS